MKQDQNRRPIETRLPSNHDAEITVIASLVDVPRHFDDVADVLKPDDFYTNRHKLIYEKMCAYYQEKGEAPDYLTLSALLENQEDIVPSDLDALLSENDHQHVLGDWKKSVKLVLGCSMQRRNIFASQRLAGIGYEITDPEKARNAVEALLHELTMDHAPQSDFESLEEIGLRNINMVDNAYKNRGKITGIPTGFGDLDRMTSGFQRKDLVLLAGRPSMGKTALGMCMGRNAARAGFTVAVFSLEMGKEQLGLRLLSLESGYPTNRIRGGWLENEEFDELVKAQDRLNELHVYIDDTSGSPVSSMRSKLRRLMAKTRKPIDLIIVDYLGLMEPEGDTSGRHNENRNLEIAGISRGLKGLARDFNAPVLALAQLSRAVENRQSKIPQLSDLRDSGTLEQDADVVMFVYRDDYYAGYDQFGKSKSDRPGTADLIIAKHRNGPVGEVALAFKASLTRFDNLEEVSPVD